MAAAVEQETASPRLGANYYRLFAGSTISNLGDGVSLVAYPWLASAVTRNPLLIALIVVVQRLPWLLFTLPAGVITDRHDRRSLMVLANVGRGAITLFVAAAVLSRSGSLPGADEVDSVVTTDAVLYGLVLTATLLLGIGEVFYDNSAQTFMPSVVRADQLEKANGRLWAGQEAANQFAGPPLASLLLAASFAVPFFLDAATFAVSAALIFAITATPRAAPTAERRPWRAELREGFGWLWRHDLLRPMAVILGVMNASAAISSSVFVLYAQEVLGASTTQFAVILMAGAVGAVVGGWTASWISRRIGSGPSLALTLIGSAAVEFTFAAISNIPAAVVMSALSGLLVLLWNVVTVSLRQTIIPDQLLGRVNSVYRFFGWGMIPVGAFAGGAIVGVAARIVDREAALRMPWIAAGLIDLALCWYTVTRLTTARMDAARARAAATASG